MRALFLYALLIVPFTLFSQSELPEMYPNESKVKVLLDFPKEGRNAKNGKGFSANVGLLPNGIKKVALVSFFVFDPGVTKTYTISGNYSVTKYYKKRSTGGLSSDICVGVLSQVYTPLKESFNEYGIELLFPDEFLDNQEKKDYYSKFEVEHEKSFANWVGKAGSGDHDVVYGYPEGFIVADIVKEPYANYTKSGMFAVKKTVVADNQIYVFDKDTKMSESLGYDLCNALGVDAVLVSYMTVWAKNDKEIQLENIRTVMFGPNPVMPEGESKHGAIPHVKGLFYIGTSVNPQAAIYKFNKKKPETANLDFTGFDVIYRAIVKTIGDYINKSK